MELLRCWIRWLDRSSSGTAVCSPVSMVLDLGHAGLEVALAEHDRVRGAGAVGALHRALEAAAAVGEVGADAGPAQLRGQRRRPGVRASPERYDEDVERRAAAPA